MIQIRATAKCRSCGPTGASNPLAGVHVSVCSLADTTCEAPLVSEDTGADGGVQLSASTQQNPLSVFLQFRKQGWLDGLLMLNTPPLSYPFDVGEVYLEQPNGLEPIAGLPNAPYNPGLAIVKLRVGDCNLRPSTRIDLVWADREGATIDGPVEEWSAIAVNLPVPATETTRVVAHLGYLAASTARDAATEPIVAIVNLVVRPGAVTLAPFVTPTPTRTP